jgi:hypothetical protein
MQMSRLLAVAIDCLVLGTLAGLIGLGFYGLLRLLRLPVNWLTIIIGSFFILASFYLGMDSMIQGHPDPGLSNSLGFLSYCIAIYAAGQWFARRWYLAAKRRLGRFLVREVRNLYLYTRAHHQFFGWLVAITASAHAIYFLVFSRESPPRWTITGIAAWAALALLVLIGLYIDRVRRTRSIRRIEPLHIGASLLFVALFVVHVA